jgi:serine/threonine protein phosphatase PrpC
MLCTDGLSDVLGNESIENELSKNDDLLTKGMNLWKSAIAHWSQDNISVVLLEVD